MTSRRALQTLSTLEVSLLCSFFMLRQRSGQTLSTIYALWRRVAMPIPERDFRLQQHWHAMHSTHAGRRHVLCVCEGQRNYMCGALQ